MKKLFLLLLLLPALAWADFGTSIDGKEASVTCTHTIACDSAWVVFGYDGDAGEADTINMYDSLRLVPCFSATGKVLCGDGLDLDSIGTHVVKIHYFSGDAVISVQMGIWEHRVANLTAADVWAEDTGGVALTKYGGAVLDYDNYKYGGGADSVRAYLAAHDSTLLEQAAACGSGTGARTVTITVLNIADSTTAISGFEVDVYDSSSGEPKGNGTTNSNGVYTCSLDDETYTVHITKTPWTLISPRRFVITANMDSTFYATAFDPGSPPSASKCRVWTLVSDLTASWLAGCRLSIWASGRYHDITFDGTTVSPYTVTGVSNDTGYVYIDVYRSAELTAGNGETVKMYIELRAPNSELIARTLKEIPDAASYEIVW